MPSTKTLMCAAACTLLLLAGGCASTTHSPSTRAMDKANLGGSELAMSPADGPVAPVRIVSLGAGDMLGRQIHFNNIVLAQRRQNSWENESLRGGPVLARPVTTVVDVPVLAD